MSNNLKKNYLILLLIEGKGEVGLDCLYIYFFRILSKKRNITINGPDCLNLFLDEAINYSFQISNQENFELLNI